MTEMTVAEFLDSADLDKFVQKNAEFYRTKWKAMAAKADTPDKLARALSWNWPAFLLGPAWLFYRKLYLLGAVWIAATIALVIAEEATGKQISSGGIGLAIITGVYANSWYFKFAFDKVAKARSAGQEAGLPYIGGTSWPAAFAALVLLILAAVGLTFGPELLDLDRSVVSNAGRTGDESEILGEMSGVWQVKSPPGAEIQTTGLLVLKLDGSDKYLFTGGQKNPITIISTDTDNLIVTLRNSTGTAASSIRQVWDAAHKNFVLLFTTPTGEQINLTYVREITAADVPTESFQSQVSQAKPQQQPAAPGPVAGASADRISGTYAYIEEGFSGELTVGQTNNAYTVHLETVNNDRLSTCGFNFSGNDISPVNSPTGGVGGLTLKDTDSQCSLLVAVTGEDAVILDKGNYCQASCGMGGAVQGQYRRKH